MRLWLPLLIVIVWLLLALFGPLLPLQPDHIELTRILASPGEQAWLGFDDLGRSLADRVIVGARFSFTSLCRCRERHL